MSDKINKKEPDVNSVKKISKELKSLKGLDAIVEFIKSLDDEYFGFQSEKTGLLDVLDKTPEGFDFFETYYNSTEAEKNRELSDNQQRKLAALREERESATSIVNNILFKDVPEVRKEFLKSISAAVEGKD